MSFGSPDLANGRHASQLTADPEPPPRLIASALGHVAAAGALTAGGAHLVAVWGGAADYGRLLVLGCFGLIAFLTLRRLGRHAPFARFGTANRVTLLRGMLTCLLAGMLPVGPDLSADMLWLASGIALIALILDGVDGWIARRQGIASTYGAGFDIDMDTVLMGVLALLIWRTGDVGAWVLLIGVLRHLFVAAGRVWPALTGQLPHSERRRVVCALQIGVLLACLTPLVTPPLSSLACAAALGLLLFSFAIDTVWLIRADGDGRTRQPT